MSFARILNIGASSQDSEALKLKKSSLIIVPLIIGPAAFIWGVLYIFLDLYLSASIPLSYAFVSVLNLWHLHISKNIIPLYIIQMVLVLLLPFFLMWSLGGFALGSFVFVWAFFAPIAALIYETKKKALYWFYAFMFLVLVSTLIDQILIKGYTGNMPQVAIELFFFLNISAGLSGVFLLIRYFIYTKEENANARLEEEHEALLEKSKELESANTKLSFYANHDALTMLPNRYFLYKTLDELLCKVEDKASAFAILFIDLDGFKEINNNYGHSVGDRLLREIATNIKALVGEENLTSRVGGDEFVLVVKNFDKLADVAEIAQKVIENINQSYPFLPSGTKVGSSIGISVFPKHSDNVDELIDFADKAMYKVKENIKNSFLFYEESMSINSF